MDEQALFQSLGRIEGAVGGVKEMLAEHIEQDTRRFDTTFKRLDALDADVNKAKGAKSAILWVAGGVGTIASGVAWAIGKILNIH